MDRVTEFVINAAIIILCCLLIVFMFMIIGEVSNAYLSTESHKQVQTEHSCICSCGHTERVEKRRQE